MRSAWLHVCAILALLLAGLGRLARTAEHSPGAFKAIGLAGEHVGEDAASLSRSLGHPAVLEENALHEGRFVRSINQMGLPHLEKSQELLMQRPATSEILFVGPDDEAEAQVIFDHALSRRAAVKAVADVRWSRELLVHAAVNRTGAQLANQIKRSDRSYIIVIGHNHNGRLIFPDGSSASLQDLAQSCDEPAKVCVFLSCNSADTVKGSSLGIGVELTYRDASAIAKRIKVRIDQNADKHLSAIQLHRDLSAIVKGGEFGIVTADVSRAGAVPLGAVGVLYVLKSRDLESS